MDDAFLPHCSRRGKNFTQWSGKLTWNCENSHEMDAADFLMRYLSRPPSVKL